MLFPPSLITRSQFSPSSVDLNIPCVLATRSTPFDSTIFITQPTTCTYFQVFPLLVDLKRAPLEPMKTVPPAVSKTVYTCFSLYFVYIQSIVLLRRTACS